MGQPINKFVMLTATVYLFLGACAENVKDRNATVADATTKSLDNEETARSFLRISGDTDDCRSISYLYVKNVNRDRAIRATIGFHISNPARQRWKDDEIHTIEPGQRKRMGERRSFCRGYYKSLSIEGARFLH